MSAVRWLRDRPGRASQHPVECGFHRGWPGESQKDKQGFGMICLHEPISANCVCGMGPIYIEEKHSM